MLHADFSMCMHACIQMCVNILYLRIIVFLPDVDNDVVRSPRIHPPPRLLHPRFPHHLHRVSDVTIRSPSPSILLPVQLSWETSAVTSRFGRSRDKCRHRWQPGELQAGESLRE